MVKTTSDKIVDELGLRSSASIGKLAKNIGTSKDEIMNAAKYLEQDGIVKIDKGFTSTKITLLKKQVHQNKAIPPPPVPKLGSHKTGTHQNIAPMPPPPQKQDNNLHQNPPPMLSAPQQHDSASQTKATNNPPIPPPAANNTGAPANISQETNTILPPSIHPKNQQQGQTLPSPSNNQTQQPASWPASQDHKLPSQGNNQATKAQRGLTQPLIQKTTAGTMKTDGQAPTQHEPFPLQQKPHQPAHLNKMMSKPPVQTKRPIKKETFENKEDFINLYPDNNVEDDPIAPQQPPRFMMRVPDPEPGMMSPPSVRSREVVPVEQEPVVVEPMPQPQHIVQRVYESAPSPKQTPVPSNFPSYATSTIDKLDYMIDIGHKKMDRHDYSELHVLYRQIYDMFQSAGDLSPNEFYLVADKINELFSRIRRVYVIEHVS